MKNQALFSSKDKSKKIRLLQFLFGALRVKQPVAVDCRLYEYQKVDDKIVVCKLSKIVKSKLYHNESTKSRRQTV